ncbi:MAG: DUF402 domain-containing protein [Lachnospiraceae bacterium]|nr:DUF402 domain-containing protein [Lachnospiraceae bacterium]
MLNADSLKLYRQRLLPQECLLLKDDIIVAANDEVVITKWHTINPKTAFDHGCSCYLLKEGIKVSKFYRADNSLLYWYCDIVHYEYREDENTLIATDLLADVIIYPDGRYKVVDLDELAEAMEHGTITNELVAFCLRSLHNLLSLLYRDKFDRLQAYLEHIGL